MEACYGGTDVMERSCPMARGKDINNGQRFPRVVLERRGLIYIYVIQYRERERELYIYIYIYIHEYNIRTDADGTGASPCPHYNYNTPVSSCMIT
jgi:hypothetical protein